MFFKQSEIVLTETVNNDIDRPPCNIALRSLGCWNGVIEYGIDV